MNALMINYWGPVAPVTREFSSNYSACRICYVWEQHGNSSQVYTKPTFLVPQMYTKIHSNQYKIIQLTWIHMVHTCSTWNIFIDMFFA